tara:strand:- start:99 stop:650 length:552 start_codon:yes stop_codon:yes gene_type:complete
METLTFFPTIVWSTQCSLDNEKYFKLVKDFQQKTDISYSSNQGGYQGYEFKDQEFMDEVANLVPTLKEDDFNSFNIYAWVNVNGEGHSNNKHSHFTSDILISGVYYVKVPEDSGNIRFYDPRGELIHKTLDWEYYHNYQYHYIKPKEGQMIFFPCWLEHDVEPNQSNDERVSIAFNVSMIKEN